MSGIFVITALVYFCRKCPLLATELLIRGVDVLYRQFLDDGIDKDIVSLELAGFEDVSWPHHHCYRRGEVEFYTTTQRIGIGSFRGWRVRMRYLPDVYVEAPEFGAVALYSPDFWCQALATRIEKDIMFLQLAAKEAADGVKV